jgi:hypothetical protein
MHYSVTPVHTFTSSTVIKTFNDIYINCSNVKKRERVKKGERNDNRVDKEKDGKAIHQKKGKEIKVQREKRKEGRKEGVEG